MNYYLFLVSPDDKARLVTYAYQWANVAARWEWQRKPQSQQSQPRRGWAILGQDATGLIGYVRAQSVEHALKRLNEKGWEAACPASLKVALRATNAVLDQAWYESQEMGLYYDHRLFEVALVR